MNYLIYLSVSIVAILAIVLFIYAITNRHKIFCIGLIGIGIALFFYSFFYSMEIIAPNAEQALLFIDLERFGIWTLPSFWVIMALEYTNKTKFLTKWTYIGLFSIPVILLIFGLTDSTHHLVYREFSVLTIEHLTIAQITPGPVYYVAFIFTNLLILLGNVLYVLFYLRNKVYQKRSFVMMMTSFIPWLGLWIYTFRLIPIGLDINPYFLGLAALIFTLAMFKNNLFDTAVVARHTVVDHISEMLLTLDGNNKIIDVNKTVEIFFNQKRVRMIGESLHSYFPKILELIEAKVNEQPDFIDFDFGEQEKKQHLRAEITYLPGEAKVIIVKDATEEVNMIRNLRYYATTDTLTEITNRSYFISLASERIRICKKNKMPIAFVIFDIDEFKQINDHYGHAAGDIILKKTASMCRNLIGPNPLLARYGGDEFILVFEEKTEEEVMILVEKIRRRMMNSNNIIDGKNISFECSFGVCYVHEIENDVLDLFIKYADEALYRSKNDGRNRATLEVFNTL